MDVQSLSAPQRRMLDPVRELALAPQAIFEVLALKGDEGVADVGAGPGFFTLKLAKAVPRGRVVATDIDAAALQVLEQRAKAEGVHNVSTRVVAPDATGLEPGSVDLAFLCQVDHYFASREAYFGLLKAALRKGGRVAVVNANRDREAAKAAAVRAGYRVVREVSTSPSYFTLLLEPSGGPP